MNTMKIVKNSFKSAIDSIVYTMNQEGVHSSLRYAVPNVSYLTDVANTYRIPLYPLDNASMKELQHIHFYLSKFNSVYDAQNFYKIKGVLINIASKVDGTFSDVCYVMVRAYESRDFELCYVLARNLKGQISIKIGG